MQNEKNDNGGEGFSRVKNTRRIELNFLSAFFTNSVGLLLASYTAPHFHLSNVVSFVALVFVIWLLNWILRPVLIVFTLPFLIITFGFGMLLINAVIIYLSTLVVPGIEIGSFWNALWASLLVSIAMWVNTYFRSEKMIRKAIKDSSGKKNDDVIDV